MVNVKLQKRISKQGRNNYVTYVITIPKIIIESISELSSTENFEIKVEKGKIILSPLKR